MRVLLMHRPGNALGGDHVVTSGYGSALALHDGVTVHYAAADDLPPLGDYDFCHLIAACAPDWGLPAAQQVKDAGKPLIVSPYWWSRDERSEQTGLRLAASYERDVQNILELATVQFAVTMSEAQQVWRLAPQLPVHLVGIGCDRPPRGLDTRPADYVVSIGRMEMHKNQYQVVNACVTLGFPLIIVGPIDQHTASELHKIDTVKCMGYVDRREMWEILARARVHALPSWFENPGLAHAEACLLGVPSVMGNRGCEPEFYGPGGHYCDPSSLIDILRAINRAWYGPRGIWAHIPTWLDMARAGLEWMENYR